jgi:hypothetical protein
VLTDFSMLSVVSKKIGSGKNICFSALKIMVSLRLQAHCGGILAYFMFYTLLELRK